MQFLGVAIAFMVALWVYSDAKKRGKTTRNAFFWFTGVFFVLILFLPLWLIRRPRVKLCSHCGEYYEYGASEYEASKGFCPRCGVELGGGE